jgi:hypothetical protein
LAVKAWFWLAQPGTPDYAGDARVEDVSFPSVTTDPTGPSLHSWNIDQINNYESDVEGEPGDEKG